MTQVQQRKKLKTSDWWDARNKSFLYKMNLSRAEKLPLRFKQKKKRSMALGENDSGHVSFGLNKVNVDKAEVSRLIQITLGLKRDRSAHSCCVSGISSSSGTGKAL